MPSNYSIKLANAPFGEHLIQEVQQYCNDNIRPDYAANYLDVDDFTTISSLMRYSKVLNAWTLLEDGEFRFFSATRDLGNGEVQMAVRLISDKNRRSIKPIHNAIVLTQQCLLAQASGFSKGLITFNVGPRTKLYEYSTNLRNYKGDCVIFQAAKENTRQFQETGVQIVNGVEQHTLTVDLPSYQAPNLWTSSVPVINWNA